MTQEIIAFCLLIFAVSFLYKTYFGKKKDNNCGGDCGCK